MATTPKPREWRGSILVLDDQPEVRKALYEAWRTLGADVEIETSPVHFFYRLRNGRFTAVFVPLAMAGRIGRVDAFVGEDLEAWAAREAPSYRGRFLYYGSPELVAEALKRDEAGESVPLLALSSVPTRQDIERSVEAIDGMIERIRRRLRQEKHSDTPA